MNTQHNNNVADTTLLSMNYKPEGTYKSNMQNGTEVLKGILAIQNEIIELGGIAKSHDNLLQRYKYRSITDMYAVVTPLMVKHGLTLVASTEVCNIAQFMNNKKELQFKAIVQVRFIVTAVSDASTFEIVMFGEANDNGDKAITKATTSAQKNFYNQVFSIPTGEESDQNNQTWGRNKQNYSTKTQPKPSDLASYKLKKEIGDRLKTYGMDLSKILSDIGLKLNTVTDEQLRNVYNEIKAHIKNQPKA